MTSTNIAVIFEKEGVNTLESAGEFLITILSSIAQEESRNISENTRWGVVRKFENGKVIVNHNKFMGYTKNEDGDLVIVKEEAEIVKTIFRMYLEGDSTGKVAKYLEEKQIKTATGKTHWHASVIEKMIRNEKYMGDALLQKTYTVDFMTKKKVMNKGIVPQYYVEDNHEPIIPKTLFYMVQEEIARRSSMSKAAVTRKKNQKSRYSGMYALTGKVICGECGHEYRRVTWSRNGQKKIVWRCTERLENGTKHCKKSPSIPEPALNHTIMNAMSRIVQDEKEFVGAFRQNVIKVLGSYGEGSEPSIYNEQIKEKQNKMLELIEENARQGAYNDEFDAKYRKIADDIEHLKQQQLEERQRKRLSEKYRQRVADTDNYLNTQTHKNLEYDDELVRKLVENVKILSAEKIQIQFQSGIVMEQEVEYE